jgi:hypothetical protein
MSYYYKVFHPMNFHILDILLMTPTKCPLVAASVLVSGTQDPGSLPAEAVGFFGQKNPQYAFLWKESKAVCPMSQICGM